MKSSSHSENSLLAKASRYLKRGETAAAITAYQEVLTLNPLNKKAKKQLSRLSSTAKSPDPGQTKRRQDLMQLMALLENKNFEDAIREAQRLAIVYPTQPLPLAVEGAALAAIGDDESAVKRYRKAMQIDPDYRQPLINLGASLSRLGRWPEAQSCFEQALSLFGKSPALLRNLGRATLRTGDQEKAVSYFIEALTLSPSDIDTLVALGEAYVSMQRHQEALQYYRKAIAIEPGNQGIEHRINALQGQNSSRAPKEYVEKVFDDAASSFERHLVEDLEYETPTRLRNILNECGLGSKNYTRILDLGCGTGLSGEAFQDISNELWGIDLSANMLSIAKKKGIYKHLIHGDILEALSDIESNFDLVICIDVLIYIGDPISFFKTVKQHVSAGAVFILSTEHQDSGDFSLLKTERYAHSRLFIEQVAHDCGMNLVKFATEKIRLEDGASVLGGLYIFEVS